MNQILATPLEARLTVIFVLGTLLGSAVNLAIYRLAWCPRAISPWSRPDPASPPRRWFDRLPIFGWLGLRREANIHGRGFWIRPMLLELLFGAGLALLYWWEVGVNEAILARAPHPIPPLLLSLFSIRNLRFIADVVLIALMLAASMIDVDEKIIPDEITIPGTLLGLFAAVGWPYSRLLDGIQLAHGQLSIRFLHLAAPNDWPACLTGFPEPWSLMIGLACLWLWCVALLPRTWYPRHGWRRALALCGARVAREPVSYRILRMGIIVSMMIAVLWYRGGITWLSTLSALVGMAAGGGLIWLVRIIGTAVLHREAMGFGDVTLMAMIGAFLGWQPCLVIFFLAPFAGLVVGLLRLILFRDREIPYGPFLCLATLFVMVYWPEVWEYTKPVFEMGWFVPVAMLVCLVLMGLMLAAWRLTVSVFRSMLRGRSP